MLKDISNARLSDLEMRGDFIRRHIGPDDSQVASMLQTLGKDSLEELIAAAVPADIVSERLLELPEPMSERNTISYLRF